MSRESTSEYLPQLLARMAQFCADSADSAFQSLASQIRAIPTDIPSPTPTTCPTMIQCLERATAQIPVDHELGPQVALIAPQAPWHEASRGVPEFFPGGYGAAYLVNEVSAPIDDPIRLGLLLQQDHIAYPGHAHDAEEFYFILSGQARWRIDDGEFDISAVDLIHHPPAAIHAMETAKEPLLAVWVWRGQLDGRFWYESDPAIDCPRG